MGYKAKQLICHFECTFQEGQAMTGIRPALLAQFIKDGYAISDGADPEEDFLPITDRLSGLDMNSLKKLLVANNRQLYDLIQPKKSWDEEMIRAAIRQVAGNELDIEGILGTADGQPSSTGS